MREIEHIQERMTLRPLMNEMNKGRRKELQAHRHIQRDRQQQQRRTIDDVIDTEREMSLNERQKEKDITHKGTQKMANWNWSVLPTSLP